MKQHVFENVYNCDRLSQTCSGGSILSSYLFELTRPWLHFCSHFFI